MILRALLQPLNFPASQAGAIIFLSTVLAHVTVATLGPSPEGYLFGGNPYSEAFCGSLLLVAPALALYAGIWGALKDRNDFWAYVGIGGGGFLTLTTACGLILAI